MTQEQETHLITVIETYTALIALSIKAFQEIEYASKCEIVKYLASTTLYDIHIVTKELEDLNKSYL